MELALPSMQRLLPEVSMWAAGVLLMGVLGILLLGGQLNLLCAVMLGLSLLLISLRSKTATILLTMAYLNLMGDIRRIVAVTVGQAAQDPLLLIGPVIVFALAFPLLLRVRLKDNLSKAMFFLLIVMFLEIFNPQQGGLSVGFSGALFYIAPVLWYWVGRQYGSPAVMERLLYQVIFPLALLAALLGFAQTFLGFLPYQQAWIDVASKTYAALHVGKSVRAFGFSSSAAEYATLLSISAAGTAAAYFTSKRKWTVLSPILVLAMILASGRSNTLKLVIALALVLVARSGRSLGPAAILKLILYLSMALLGVFFVASHFAGSESSSSGKSSAVQDALSHEAGGLAHPLDQRYSTASIHRDMFLNGMLQAVTDPIGHGLGSTTLAAVRSGSESTFFSSEIDLSDMVITLGLAGGLLYGFIVVAVFQKALRYTQTTYAAVSLPVLAVITATLAAWLIAGQYATSSLLFFLIGGLVYERAGKLPTPAASEERREQLAC